MGILRNFWDRLFSRVGKSASHGGQAVAVADKLEGEISAATHKLEGELSAVTHESQALAEEVQRVRTEAEHARVEEHRKLVELEQVHQGMEAARDADQRKLAALESLNARLHAAREADSKLIGELGERIEALEQSRTETDGAQRQVMGRVGMLEQSRIESEGAQRQVLGRIGMLEQSRVDMEGKNRQVSERVGTLEQSRSGIEDTQRQVGERVDALEQSRTGIEDAQRKASERVGALEQSRTAIEDAQRQVGERIEVIEQTQTRAASALEKAGQQISTLQSGSQEQARQFRASLADASIRLDDASTHISKLEIRTRHEREDYLKTFDSIMGRYRKQESRLNWALFAAVFALLLGAGAGAALVWDVQKNARTLADMSDDIKTLMNTVQSQQSRQQISQPVRPPQPAVSVVTPPPPTKPATPPVVRRPAPETSIDSAPAAPAAYLDNNPGAIDLRFLSNPSNAGRVTNRQGIRQYQRQEASSFFEENAKVAGVVSLSSGAQYRVVKAGSGKSPTDADTILINYVGTKLDGSIIDETYSKGVPKTVSMGEVLPAWREVLQKMEEGAEVELYLPANQSTRRSTRKRGITGFEPHIYLIELIQVVKGGEADAVSAVN